MEIVVNGEPRRAPDGCTLLELLQALAIEPSRIAIELNGEIVKKAQWPEVRVPPNATLEIVHFVGGG
ncbi:MAG TPA: sulfur carrier protein ThiS [Bryobacteraceae bacterium]|nr:sulfur carrier protein ThiS [Bryobacteraceae bacterium]